LTSLPTQSESRENAVEITKDESGQVLKIAGALGIGAGGELRNALRDFVCGSPRPIIDLSEVDVCDTAALQLLCSAGKTAERSGKPFELAGLSPAVRTTSAALGLPLPEAPTKGGDEHAV
jgi:anti-anti-sigma regulatory factor